MKEKILNILLDRINEYGLENLTILEQLFLDNYDNSKEAYLNAILLKYSYYADILNTDTIYGFYITNDMIYRKKLSTLWNCLDIDDRISITKTFKINQNTEWYDITQINKNKIEKYFTNYFLI